MKAPPLVEDFLRLAYEAGYREGYEYGHDDGEGAKTYDDAPDDFRFSQWLAIVEGGPRVGGPRFQPLVVLLPLRIQSTANKREHWRALAKRKKEEKRTTELTLKTAGPPPELPVKVTLTRIGPRRLDTDNLAGGFKSVRDSVAAWLGADDKPGSGITWHYAQARPTTPKTYAAQVLIEPGEE